MRTSDGSGGFARHAATNRRDVGHALGARIRTARPSRSTMPSVSQILPRPTGQPARPYPQPNTGIDQSSSPWLISERAGPVSNPVGWVPPSTAVTVPSRPVVTGLPDWYLNNVRGAAATKPRAQTAALPVQPGGGGITYIPQPQNIVRSPPPPPAPTIQQRNPNVALDLGNIITSLGGQYINARYNSPVPQVQPVSGISPYIPDALEPYMFDSPVGGGGGCCDAVVPAPPRGYHYNRKGCLTKNRRRRKRLATASDIKDLSALKAVIGPTQLKTWIATH